MTIIKNNDPLYNEKVELRKFKNELKDDVKYMLRGVIFKVFLPLIVVIFTGIFMAATSWTNHTRDAAVMEDNIECLSDRADMQDSILVMKGFNSDSLVFKSEFNIFKNYISDNFVTKDEFEYVVQQNRIINNVVYENKGMLQTIIAYQRRNNE